MAVATAHATGLDKVVENHLDDLMAAAASARSFRAGLGSLRDPAGEPWPPMRAVEKP